MGDRYDTAPAVDLVLCNHPDWVKAAGRYALREHAEELAHHVLGLADALNAAYVELARYEAADA